MRKAAWFIILLLTVITTIHAQQEIKSTIKTAQVYTQGAQVERSASVTLKTGENEFKITQLSADLDPNTIQIGGSGFTILSVRHEIDFIEEQSGTAKAEELKRQKQMLFDSVKLVDLELNILKKQMTLLDNNMSIVGDEGIKNDDFQDAVNYFSKRYEALTRRTFELETKKIKLANRLALINLQIKSDGQQSAEPSSSIYLVLDSKKSQKADLDISYAISQAGWFPAYDIRATDTKSPLALTYKARVFQNSGVDWKNVKLRISSGNLEVSGTAPELQPFLLGINNRNYQTNGPITTVTGVVKSAEDGLPLPQVTVFVKGTTLGTPTDQNGRYTLQIPAGSPTLVFRYIGYITQEIPVTRGNINVNLSSDATALEEVVVTGYGMERSLQGRVPGVQMQQDNIRIRGVGSPGNTSSYKVKEQFALKYQQINYQTSFVYDIDLPYDIPSTGKPEVVDIKIEMIDANYQYTAAPKAAEKAYLVAQIADWTDLNLLDGTSNLYFQNSFIGQSIIDTHLGSDTLKVSLGNDEGIIVNRQRKKDFEQRRFFSNKKREERHFEITVLNTKKEQINMVVYDQIPISVSSDTKVNATELDGGKLDSKTGLVTWTIQLKPGEKKVLQLKYSVDLPKYQNIDIN